MSSYNFFPLISAVSGAVLIVITKFILTKKHTLVRDYIPFLFLAIFILLAPVVNLRPLNKIQPPNVVAILLFLLVIILACLWNVLYYRAIKLTSVQEFELIDLFSPFFTILLAALIYQNERKLFSLLFALLAFGVLLISHLFEKGLKLPKQTPYLFLVIFLMAMEAIFWEPLLNFFSPFMLYFLRCGIIAAIFILLWRPSYHNLKKQGVLGLIVLSGLFAIFHMVSRMYGFKEVGIVVTMATYVLTPMLVFILDALILRERLKIRNLLAAAFIIFFAILAQIK
jgi:drug/metabolite transporter (DMT)-like permease